MSEATWTIAEGLTSTNRCFDGRMSESLRSAKLTVFFEFSHKKNYV